MNVDRKILLLTFFVISSFCTRKARMFFEFYGKKRNFKDFFREIPLIPCTKSDFQHLFC